MDFTDYTYLWPPRPETASPPNLLRVYEREGWIAQVKKNGTCNVLAVAPDKTIIAMNRHKENHKLWRPTTESARAFRSLPGKGWYVFATELLHSKGGGFRDTNYVFDVLVDDGEYLVSETLDERLMRLDRMFDARAETHSHREVDDNTWVARTFRSGFDGLFASLSDASDEGLVLKDPTAPLALCARQSANSKWQVKTRKPTKNYSF